ncbi:ImmA/IrrE family metallo-endopeptidase [Thioalkalivibrio nitratireducens]|uniref:ImmA/IrrE family metallo-endopeptidase n=1 Tax=Thioalkalivibrio nitratireducens TaxID=186931 RepID=UPI000302DD12|nr:ImmA/IrrE family metallo-endopeptidase [Thioalkalivibrio nitratireducens]
MPMEAKVIRTEQQYHAYLDEVQMLMAQMPPRGTPESERLELLTVLIEAYENQKYPIEAPDPVDAILFRMQEKGLKQIDLVPYFGTRSRVSEVLSRKRPLTVQMIRALSVGLGISTETLVGISDAEQSKREAVDWRKFPLKEMVARGWLRKMTGKAPASAEETVKDFVSSLDWGFGVSSFRRTLGGEAYSPTTKYALYAWLARVVQRAREKRETLGPFERSALSASFLREVAQLSWSERGPLIAVEFLEKHGIAVVIEPHLKGTMLDGAALKDADGTPVIGMTLRHDRIDNFWFTLIHEIAHLWKHVDTDEAFLDDLDAPSEDRREAEANRLAREALIPRVMWKRSDAYLSPSRETIDRLARDLKVHPAVIAGRLRRESGNYQQFSELVGQGEVRHLFASNAEELG